MTNTQKNQEYRKTYAGLPIRMYSNQVTNSKRRGMPKPSYTGKEFKEWLFTQPLYKELYDLWVLSDYKRMTVPSVDRINHTQPYTFDNIQLMTWDENNLKGLIECPRVHLVNSSRCVEQWLDGELIHTYKSITEASQTLSIHHGNISKCCRGKVKTCGGFVWKYPA